MRTIIDTVAHFEKAFANHSLTLAIEADTDPARLRSLMDGLTYWVYSFQDILRRNVEWTNDPVLRQIARDLQQDDRGHDEWFKHDLKILGIDNRDALFRQRNRHARIRDNTYRINGLLGSAPSDHARLGAMLAIEACGRVFFRTGAGYAKRAVPELAPELKWLADTHADAEAGHDIWEDATREKLGHIVLPEDAVLKGRLFAHEVGALMIDIAACSWNRS